ncbi:MAG: rhodanese-like domain-containing protein, partial [Eubacteriales bacterium]|nr:rhodanese-like domain-containing protein [Eubacteriales bacterium]
ENERGLTIPAENEKHIPRGLLEWQADKKLDKKDKIVVYCRTGDRGAYATAQLRRMGFRNAVNLKGGIVARMEAGHPVKTFNLGEIVVRDYRFKP